MSLERFDPVVHVPLMREWCAARGTPLPWDAVDFYPRIGFVADGCAASFLYQTDSKVGLIDGTVADPRVDSEVRSRALDAVLQAVVREAEALGLKALLTYTTAPTLLAKVPNLGGRVQGDGYAYIAWRF